MSACVVAALQTVGAILVIAMVITPGATAYLLTDKFKTLIKIAVALGAITGFVGVYLSYYLDGATGGVIVTLQTLLFLLAFLFSPKYGLISQNDVRWWIMTEMFAIFVEPFQFTFMQNALLTALVVAVICALSLAI